jgi:hypothetical protein
VLPDQLPTLIPLRTAELSTAAPTDTSSDCVAADLRLGTYAISRKPNHQTPHAEDEIHAVQRGRT